MNNKTNMIVMLTYNDHTVKNAYEIFNNCKDSKAQYWGFKEEPLNKSEMKKLFDYMKALGKTTVLEVVAYTEDKCLDGAKTALECNCDILMGTVFFKSVNAFCKEHKIKYMPFVGNVSGRPSILEGDIETMIQDANYYISQGAYGIDFLGYRYNDNAEGLIKKFVESVNAPVCIAGSVNSFERLSEVTEVSPWGFTVGSAFFDNAFGDGFEEQINTVYEYVKR